MDDRYYMSLSKAPIDGATLADWEAKCKRAINKMDGPAPDMRTAHLLTPHLMPWSLLQLIHGYRGVQQPIPMVLHCPKCTTQHVDAPDPDKGWTNPPHKSHLCHKCGFIWRPADVPTVGVEKIKTRGKVDSDQRTVDVVLTPKYPDGSQVLANSVPATLLQAIISLRTGSRIVTGTALRQSLKAMGHNPLPQALTKELEQIGDKPLHIIELTTLLYLTLTRPEFRNAAQAD
jgi:hypothetical protein